MATAAQHLALQRALTRAQRDGIRITTWGSINGRRAWWVTSASRPNKEHVVVLTDGQLVCDCEAAFQGLLCKHRAVVHVELVRERRAAEQAAAVQVAQDHHTCPLCDDAGRVSEESLARDVSEDTWTLTPKGRALAIGREIERLALSDQPSRMGAAADHNQVA